MNTTFQISAKLVLIVIFASCLMACGESGINNDAVIQGKNTNITDEHGGISVQPENLSAAAQETLQWLDALASHDGGVKMALGSHLCLVNSPAGPALEGSFFLQLEDIHLAIPSPDMNVLTQFFRKYAADNISIWVNSLQANHLHFEGLTNTGSTAEFSFASPIVFILDKFDLTVTGKDAETGTYVQFGLDVAPYLDQTGQFIERELCLDVPKK